MKPRSYSQALESALAPLGFTRNGADWIRRTGDVEDCVSLYKSGGDGSMHVDLLNIDLKSSEIMKAALGPGRGMVRWWISQPLSRTYGQRHLTWKNDPNGPSEVAEKVKAYGPMFFDLVRDLKSQAYWFGLAGLFGGVWRQGPTVVKLAVTLHRMGQHELCCRALDVPRRKHEIPSLAADIGAARRYFQCPPTENWPD
jgi:hypothetical protein